MKTMKRFSAILLAVLMLVAMMAAPASAAEPTYSITITQANANHTYKAYQIFQGDLHDGILSNITWGDGVNTTGQSAMGSASAKASTLTTEALALEFARTMVTNGYLQNAISSAALTNESYVFSGLTAGYYLVVDTLADGTPNEAISQYIIQVVGNVSMQPKSGVPTIKKLVSRDGTSYAEGISASIGDSVYYKATVSLHSQVNTYANYYVQVVDDIPAGITFVENTDNLKIYVENGSVKKEVNPSFYDVAYDGGKLTVTFADIHDAIQAATGFPTAVQDTLVIYYTATLNDQAVIGSAGNVNVAKVIYSDDPNEVYTGTGIPTSLGETSSDDATVYSYKLSLKKVDATESSKALEGATFLVYIKEGGSTAKYLTFDANGLLTGYTYNEKDATPITTGADGMVSVQGLASGTYWMHETEAPAGYNLNTSDSAATMQGALDGNTGKLGTMTATPTNAAGAEVVLDNGNPTGEVILTVTNHKGATLPTTGGIGTTVFYCFGGLLVIGALSLLFVRKRTTAK